MTTYGQANAIVQDRRLKARAKSDEEKPVQFEEKRLIRDLENEADKGSEEGFRPAVEEF